MEIVMQHYQQLREKRDHLKQAAIQTTRQIGQQVAPATKAW
jgi:hypothetical protein